MSRPESLETAPEGARAGGIGPAADRPGGPPRGLAEAARRALIVVSIAAAAAYIAWRAAFTYHPEYLAYSVLFIAVDGLGVISFATFAITLWNLTPRPPAPPPREGLSVDVWIPTLSEEEAILRRTITHCVAMDYPHRTYVLDDGRRPWVKALCDELGAEYVTRPDNAHAKAGNLNHALAHTRGDLIATFDADFVPAKSFLTRLLGYFEDPRVALVQTPQDYHNIDSFQHRYSPRKRELWSTQDLFFDALMVGKDNQNAAFWTGTNAILRREAIEDIGGFPTASIVEDMLTTVELHARGWKTAYVNEPLAFGIAPAYVGQFLSQRLRWVRGVMQIVRAANPLLTRGLTLRQRMSYLNSVLHFFEGLPRAVYYLVPGLYLCTGATPMFLKPAVLQGVLLYLALHLLAVKVISRGSVKLLLSEIYGLVHFLTYLRGNLALLTGGAFAFGVTPKRGKQRIALGHLLGPLLVFGFSAGSLAYAYLRRGAPGGGELDTFALAVTVPFCSFYAVLALVALFFALRRPYNPDDYYFYDALPIEVGRAPGLSIARALNERELVLLSPARLRQDEATDVLVHFPGERHPARINVRRCARLLDAGDVELFESHAVFDPSGNGLERRLVRHFFEHSVPRFRRRVARGPWHGLVPPRAPRDDLGLPIHLETPAGGEPRVAVIENLSRTGLLAAVGEPVPVGTPVCVSFARWKRLPGRVARVSDERGEVPGLVRLGIALDYAVEPPRELIRAAGRHARSLFRRRLFA